MQVFVNMTNTSAWIFDKPYAGHQIKSNTARVLQMWRLDAAVPASEMLQAASFAEVVARLRALPEEAVLGKQEALARERGKFMYAPAGWERGGGSGGTPLTDVIIRRLCEHAARLKAGGGAAAAVS